MAEGDLIQYQGNKNPLSISRAETSNAPRAKSAQVAAARQNTNIDNTFSQTVANSIQLATAAFNAVAENSEEIIAERGTESANRYSKFLNGRLADSQTGVTDDKGITKYTTGSLEGVTREPSVEDYSNRGNLIASGKFLDAEIMQIENDDSLSRTEKDTIIKNLDKLTNSDFNKLRIGTRDDLFEANNKTTRSKMYPQIQESFRAEKMTYKDIVDGIKPKLKSLHANGEPDATVHTEMLKAISIYGNDTEIIGARFAEAEEELTRLEKTSGGITEDFTKYYQALQKANMANVKRDRAALKALDTKELKAVKTSLEDMNRDLNIHPNAKLPVEVTANGLDNTLENLTADNITATLEAVTTAMGGTEYEAAMVKLGYSDSKIAAEKAKYAQKYMVKMVANELSTITSKGLPLDNLDPEIKKILTPDFINEVTTLVGNKNYDVVNEYMEGNDKTVAPIVKNRVTNLFRNLTTVATEQEFMEVKNELGDIVSNVEAHYLNLSDDQRVRVQALNKFSMGEYLVLDKTIKDGLYKQTLTEDSLNAKTTSLWNDDTVAEIIENVPYHDQARLKEIALTEQTLTGTVDPEELYKTATTGKLENGAYITNSIITKDMKSKGALNHVTNEIASRFGKEAGNLVIYKNAGMVTVTEGNALLARYTEDTFKEMYKAGEIKLNTEDAERKSKANGGVYDRTIQALKNLF